MCRQLDKFGFCIFCKGAGPEQNQYWRREISRNFSFSRAGALPPISTTDADERSFFLRTRQQEEHGLPGITGNANRSPAKLSGNGIGILLKNVLRGAGHRQALTLQTGESHSRRVVGVISTRKNSPSWKGEGGGGKRFVKIPKVG